MSGLFYLSPRKGKIKTKATFLKIYTVLYLTRQPETIYFWQTFLWTLGSISDLRTKKRRKNKMEKRTLVAGTLRSTAPPLLKPSQGRRWRRAGMLRVSVCKPDCKINKQSNQLTAQGRPCTWLVVRSSAQPGTGRSPAQRIWLTGDHKVPVHVVQEENKPNPSQLLFSGRYMSFET